MVSQKKGARLATVCLCCGNDVDATHQVDRPAYSVLPPMWVREMQEVPELGSRQAI